MGQILKAWPCASTSVTATQMHRFRRPQRPASDLWVHKILQDVQSEYYTLHGMFTALNRGHTQLFRCRVHVVYDVGYSFQTGRALCICPRLACSRTCPLPPLSASSSVLALVHSDASVYPSSRAQAEVQYIQWTRKPTCWLNRIYRVCSFVMPTWNGL